MCGSKRQHRYPFYDPMIAKMIVKGQTRTEAIEKLETALRDYRVEGIKTNLPLLIQAAATKAFKEGDVTTDFLKQHL